CLFCFVALHPLRATLFPYTTLFRSLYRFGQFHVNRVVWRGFWLIRERHGSFRGKSQQRYRSEAKNDPGNHADVPPFHRFLRLLFHLPGAHLVVSFPNCCEATPNWIAWQATWSDTLRHLLP